MKIYLAGMWCDRVNIRKIMAEIEEAHGHRITHYWPDMENGPNTPEFLGNCAKDDIIGVKNADVVIILMTDPKYPYRGTFTEIGAALALEKRIFIVGCPEESYAKTNCFFWHPNIEYASTLQSVLQILNSRSG